MEELMKKIEEQDKKIDAIYASVEKTRRYIQWSFIAGIVTVVVPVLGLIAIIPWFLKTMSSAYSGLL